MARLRIALFSSAPEFARRSLEELAAAHEVIAYFRPRPRLGLRGLLRGVAGRFHPCPAQASARRLGIPVIDSNGANLAERVRAARPDLLCIAIYPGRVNDDVLAGARLGAVNAHPSLLPRHRGPLPLFWTYHADDRETGLTIHHATQRLDAGDIVMQERFALPRGYPATRLDADMAARVGLMLRASADAFATGTATRLLQDESKATSARFVQPGEAMVDFATWDVERVWHFLAALAPRWQEPLADTRGRKAAYGRVMGFTTGGASLPPGMVERSGGAMRLHCRGGIVELA